MITEGKMQYLYDETGRRYLDVSLSHSFFAYFFSSCLAQTSCTCCYCCRHHPTHAKQQLACCNRCMPYPCRTVHAFQVFAGIVTVSVGHCHPKVVAAVDRQSHLLQHTTNIYLNNEIAEYAQELTSTLPGSLNVSH